MRRHVSWCVAAAAVCLLVAGCVRLPDLGSALLPDPALERAVREAIGKPSERLAPSDLVGLTTLDASGLGITDIEGLQYGVDLTTLLLGSNIESGTRNRIQDIAPLRALANLEILSIDDNDVSDLAPLAEMTKLRQLFASGNDIERIDSLESLTELELLTLGRNRIADLRPLAGLHALAILQLRDNRAVDLAPLAGLVRLEYLSLFGNDIVEIAPLAGLLNLVILYLEDNRITDIAALAGLRALRHLGLSGNLIHDITPLAANTGLGDGAKVDLRCNRLDARPGSPDAALVSHLIQRGAVVQW